MNCTLFPGEEGCTLQELPSTKPVWSSVSKITASSSQSKATTKSSRHLPVTGYHILTDVHCGCCPAFQRVNITTLKRVCVTEPCIDWLLVVSESWSKGSKLGKEQSQQEENHCLVQRHTSTHWPPLTKTSGSLNLLKQQTCVDYALMKISCIDLINNNLHFQHLLNTNLKQSRNYRNMIK